MFEVKYVDAGSPAARCGIKQGDRIVSINGERLIDYIDYVYFCAQEKLKITLLTNNQSKTLRIKKSEDEDLGLSFTQPLLGKKRVCANKCKFCFVDQLPKGMRRSLYVKDEDWRYSFVMGNYVTFSTTSRSEMKRIIKRRVSPLYISVHTVDETLRKNMLGNQNANAIRPLLKKFAAKNIRFHTQAVVCPGMNDKEKLTETIQFLRRLYPMAMSLAVVPVGLTEHRQGLADIAPVSKQMARETVKEVEKWQKECLNSISTRFVFAADEYYIKAGLDLPPAESYESFDQIENGVGLMRKFLDEAESALENCESKNEHISIATGQDAYPFFLQLAKQASERCGVKIDVYMVKNETFGGGVTVSGLLGGRDFLRALSGKELGKALLISANALRDGTVFLDDVTLEELQQALNMKICPVADGEHFARLIKKAEVL